VREGVRLELSGPGWGTSNLEKCSNWNILYLQGCSHNWARCIPFSYTLWLNTAAAEVYGDAEMSAEEYVRADTGDRFEVRGGWHSGMPTLCQERKGWATQESC
jgi:hypothetical protein